MEGDRDPVEYYLNAAMSFASISGCRRSPTTIIQIYLEHSNKAHVYYNSKIRRKKEEIRRKIQDRLLDFKDSTLEV
jgi:hypothetical protein